MRRIVVSFFALVSLGAAAPGEVARAAEAHEVTEPPRRFDFRRSATFVLGDGTRIHLDKGARGDVMAWPGTPTPPPKPPPTTTPPPPSPPAPPEPLPTGSYKLQSGATLLVVDGVVTNVDAVPEVRDAMAKLPAKPPAP